MSFSGVWTVIKNSRWYSADMTVFSCLACFLFALGDKGNVLNGIVAFAGILFAHMAANLFDDYSDYKLMLKNPRTSEFAPEVKCAYLRKNESSLNDLLFVIAGYCAIALATGLILFLRTGMPVIWLALAGGTIVLLYPVFSRYGLSEAAVGTAFGPLLFEGMYYVMTGRFSLKLLFLALAVVMFTVGVMYVHTLLDYDGDRASGKATLALSFNDKEKAYKTFWGIYISGYVFLMLFAFWSKNYFCILGMFSVPFVIALYRLVRAYETPENYMRDKAYLRVLKSSARVMALFTILVSAGLFFHLMINFFLINPIVI